MSRAGHVSEHILYRGFVIIVFSLLFTIPWCIRRFIRHQKSKWRFDITSTPTVPEWLEDAQEEEISKLRLSRIVVHCKPYTFECETRGKKEKPKEAVKWVQSILDYYSRRGTSVGRIPDDACTVSVPMENFKCGDEGPCDFVPVTGVASDSEVSYQMFGDSRIQVATYTEGGVRYIAGFCVYIPKPYEKSTHYRTKVIEQCYESRRFRKGSTSAERNSQNYQSTVDETSSRTDDLKTKFCKKIGQPVMIGLEDGKTKHFIWCPVARKFKTTECSECKMEDDPPAYELVRDL